MSALQAETSALRLNEYTENDQEDASVAVFNGNFLVAYESVGYTGTQQDVVGVVYDPDSNEVTGQEQILTNAVLGDQSDPSLSFRTDSSEVIAWEDNPQDINRIKFSLNTADGDQLTKSIDSGTVEDFNPQTQVLADGGFVVAWEARTADTITYGDQTNSDYDLKFQVFNGDGSARSGVETVPSAGGDNAEQYLPDMAATEDGGFVMTWTEKDFAQDGSGVAFQANRARFDGSGDRLWARALSADSDAPVTRFSTVTTLADGRQLATWRAEYDGGTRIEGRFLDGASVGKVMQISGQGSDYSFDPSVVALDGGGFVVSWSVEADSETGSRDVVMQRFDTDGQKLGQQVTVAGGAADQYDSVVAINEAGNLFVTWTGETSDADQNDIYSRVYSLGRPETSGPNDNLDNGGSDNGGSDNSPQPTPNDDDLTGTNGADVIALLAGDDRYDGLAGNDTIYGNEGNDVLLGGDGADHIEGQLGDDTVVGGNGRDTVYLNEGDDVFLDNGQGGEFGQDTVFANEGDDIIQGGNGDDVFYGQIGQDEIHGRLGNDRIYGGPNADRLYAGAGNDIVNGGLGTDTAYLGEGNDVYLDNGQGGALGQDTVFGNAGDDTIQGGNGDDAFYGQVGNDEIYGRLGNDRIYGGFGADKIYAGNGDDVVAGGNGPDLAYLGLGNDTFIDTGQGGELGQDTVYALGGNDTIQGGNGNDAFYGGSGNDLILSRLGNDSVYGGDGADRMFAGNGDDLVIGGNGPDRAFLGLGNDTYVDNGQGGTLGQDTVFAGAGDDVIKGGNGADEFHGEDGNDLIFGRLGNDRLEGGAGEDRLVGGEGADTFVFSGGSGADTVADLEVGIDNVVMQGLTESEVSFSDGQDGLTLSWDSGQVLFEDLHQGDLTSDDLIFT